MVRIDPCHGSDPGSIPGSFEFYLNFNLAEFFSSRSWRNIYPENIFPLGWKLFLKDLRQKCFFPQVGTICFEDLCS